MIGPKTMSSLLLLLLRVFNSLWTAVVCPLAVLLMVASTTLAGFLFACGAFLLGTAPAMALLKSHRRGLRRAALIPFGGWVAITVGLFLAAPNGRPREGARVQNRYDDGAWHYQRFALGALLPEIDQFMLGFRLIPVVDRLFTVQQIRSVRRLTRAIYTELEADADFHALGSAMPDAYDQVLGRPFDHGHYFLYIPPGLGKAPAPALVFLHGTGGNFKAYTWVLSRMADELGMVLIAPSFGMGRWDAQRGTRAVLAALDDAANVVPLDMNQVHLAGLSNGGLGVSRVAASDAGRRFRSLIFLSPVCDKSALTAPQFVNQWRDKAVLIITGDADDRVTLPYVTRCAELMRKSGANAEMSIYPADHFLFFTHRDRLLEELTTWLRQHANRSH